MTDAPAAAIVLEGVTRRFGALTAVDAVSLVIPRGEVFAIVGENGAGKSTLMNVVYGIHRADAGTIRVRGEAVSFRSPADAIEAGIGMVHQHFTLVRTLTVAENVSLGDEPVRGAWTFDRRASEEKVKALAKDLGFTIDPRALVGDLPVGGQQRVEILKSLSRGAETLLLDEPTAVLTPQESDELFAVLRRLAAQGKSVVFVSHKLQEVMAVSSRVAVMRAGRLTAQLDTATTTAKDIAREMVGRDPEPLPPKAAALPGAPVLVLEGVSARDDRGLPALRDVSLEVRAGEIVGVAGVEGNGQAELVEVIAALRPADAGAIRVLGRDARRATPAQLLDGGLAHIPGDRLHRAVIAEMSVGENVLLGRHRERRFSGALGLDRAAMAAEAARVAEALDVRPRDPSVPLGSLSGGNQQKAVVGRELGRAPKLLLADHPTRGVDVGAIERIHAAILAERARGVGVLLVTADLGELLALADRVVVLYGGRIAHRVDASATDERALGPHMTGAGA